MLTGASARRSDRQGCGAQRYGSSCSISLALLASKKELACKVNSLERKVSVHEHSIGQLADAMSELLAAPAPPPQRPIGFHPPRGQRPKQEDLEGKSKT